MRRIPRCVRVLLFPLFVQVVLRVLVSDDEVVFSPAAVVPRSKWFSRTPLVTELHCVVAFLLRIERGGERRTKHSRKWESEPNLHAIDGIFFPCGKSVAFLPLKWFFRDSVIVVASLFTKIAGCVTTHRPYLQRTMKVGRQKAKYSHAKIAPNLFL